MPDQIGMPILPIGLRADRAPCLLVGGGAVALRKARWLAAHACQIEVVAVDFLPGFLDAPLCHIRCSQRAYQPGSDLTGYLLAVAATDDHATNQAVADDADRARIPVNVVDDPARCTAIIPATVVRGDLRIAVHTGGGAPSLARRLREELEVQFGPWYANYLEELAEIREQLRSSTPSEPERQRLLAGLTDPTLRERCAELTRGGMRDLLRHHLDALRRAPGSFPSG